MTTAKKSDSRTSWPVHIVPMNDIKDHVAEMECWCCPTLDDGDEWGYEKIFIHHSADGREAFETGARKPS